MANIQGTLFSGDQQDASAQKMTHSQKSREKKRREGRCDGCGIRPRVGKSSLCLECKVARKKQNTAHHNTARKYRDQHGLCRNCGTALTSSKKTCEDCLSLRSRDGKVRREQRRKDGLCAICGLAPSPNGRNCDTCRKNMRERAAKRSKEFNERGLCGRCGGKGFNSGDSVLCYKHWMQQAAQWSCGGKTSWPILSSLWESQQGLCRYTGVKLTPSRNASLDHIVPSARGGGSEPQNLQWVHMFVNAAKRDFTDEEFVGLCAMVVASRTEEEIEQGKRACLERLVHYSGPWAFRKRNRREKTTT